MNNQFRRLAIAFTMLFSGQALSHGTIDIGYLHGVTDSNGVFNIPHSYYTGTNECTNNTLVGASVAILQKGINAWYMQIDRNEAVQALAFDANKVSGYFNTPGLENQAVRVVLFIRRDALC